MTTHCNVQLPFMKKQNLNPYDLNRTEYAELLGITPNAVRMRLRHGKLDGEYKFENGKYFFRAPEKERANQGMTPGQKTTLKKIYRRGNHYKANYPNEAFRKHNVTIPFPQREVRILNPTGPSYS